MTFEKQRNYASKGRAAAGEIAFGIVIDIGVFEQRSRRDTRRYCSFVLSCCCIGMLKIQGGLPGPHRGLKLPIGDKST
jgi:hypothetical protein